jgi:DNA mismatch repair protein MutS
MAAIELHQWYRQYRALKHEAGSAVLFFRFGDFYETFDEDAKLIAELLDVTLTRKDYAVDRREPPERRKLFTPMAGMPYHAVERYVADLVGRGYRVAIAEQISETEATRSDTRPRSVYAGAAAQADGAGKMVQRAIVRIITPGTLSDPGLLDGRANNYLAAVLLSGAAIGFAYCDVSTGEFAATALSGPRAAAELQAELARLQPAEILVSDLPDEQVSGLTAQTYQLTTDLAPLTKDEREVLLPTERVARRLDAPGSGAWAHGRISAWPTRRWELEIAQLALREQFGQTQLLGLGIADRPLLVRSAGALLQYLQETQRRRDQPIRLLRSYTVGSTMLLDVQTRRNLELLDSSGRQGKRASLVAVLDETKTPMGARLLRRWIAQPLTQLGPLQVRQRAVAALYNATLVREEIRVALAAVGDAERAAARIAQGAAGATPRDLVQLRAALRALPAVCAAAAPLIDAVLAAEEADDEPLQLDPCDDLRELLEQALDDDPPALLGVSNYLRGDDESAERGRRLVRAGYDQRLDNLIRASRHAQEFIDRLEARERERTGIRTLKVGYNSVFGYYIELSRTIDNALVPPHYERKQTLVNAERYVTEELKYYEGLVSDARLKLLDIEREVFTALCGQLTGGLARLRRSVDAVARLDVLAGLAEAAVRGRYVCPRLVDSATLQISGGRHPVVERLLDDPFIGNDLVMDSSDRQILLITGPNMSGKSTFMRQVALMVLMAQIGSFVPADAAEIGLVDRIFTRIGAQDDIATGQSTFMVEMTETAALLAQCTARSLIVLDEVGRGTSTYDGMAIARAILEYLHEEPSVRSRVLFATHYHELTALAEQFPRLQNVHLAAIERDGQVVFLHELRPGAADRSYGIHVAALAGLPASVIGRAAMLLADYEARNTPAAAGAERQPAEPVERDADEPPARRRTRPSSSSAEQIAGQLSLFASVPHPLVAYLQRLQIDALTPLEALNRLAELQRLAREVSE